MRAYLRDGSAQTILCTATLRQKLQTKLSISSSYSILTPGQPVPALTLQRQAPGRVGCQFLSHWYDLTPEKSLCKRDSKPGSSALEADALTTRPMRRSRCRRGSCGEGQKGKGKWGRGGGGLRGGGCKNSGQVRGWRRVDDHENTTDNMRDKEERHRDLPLWDNSEGSGFFHTA